MATFTKETASSGTKTCASLLFCDQKKSVVFDKNGFSITECKQCGHLFLPLQDTNSHLEKNYSDDYFFGGGDGYPNYLLQKDILTGSGKRYAKILHKYVKPGKLLDVGSAAGFILKGFEQSGWQCWGVEPNDTMARYGRMNLGLNITTGGLETFSTSEKFDVVSMIQVIGHFYDIDKSINNISDLLTKDGHLLIESWNRKSIVAQIQGLNWHEYSPPTVVHWFSEKSLKSLLKYHGFELVAKGYPAKRINIGHALSFMEGKSTSPFKKKLLQVLKRVFGKINVIYPPLDVNWYLFKKVMKSNQ